MADETPPAAAPGSETPGAETARDAVASAAGSALSMVLDVPLEVTVEIGHARMLVQEVLQLSKGSVIELDRLAGEPADVRINGRLVARGEVTVVDERVAVRLVEMVGSNPGMP